MDLDPPFRAVNPAPSSYAFIAAAKTGSGDLGALVHAFTGAVWRDNRDIAQDDEIRACLETAGFDPALATSGMLAGAEEYAANLEEAVNVGAFGAPFYIVDGTEKFWGQDRIEDLDLYLAGKL
ncbi:MAG: DsbA family protein, partial [Pseudomonadota bacterium]